MKIIRYPFIGTWGVGVTSGPLWFRFFNLLRDKKVIENCGRGYNLAWGKVQWGKFAVKDYPNHFAFIYDSGDIVDIVNFVTKDKISGKFYRKKKYIGNFEMTREKS